MNKCLIVLLMFSTAVINSLAADVPLRDGKIISGEIVATVPAKIRVKTESGAIREINLDQIEYEYYTNLPVEISSPYLRSAMQQDLINTLEFGFNFATNAMNFYAEQLNESMDRTQRILLLLDENESSSNIKNQEKKATPIKKNSVTWSKVNSLYGYTQFGWKTTVKAPKYGKYNINVTFYDSNGYAVFTGAKFLCQLSTGSQSVSEVSMVEDKTYTRLKSADATLVPLD